MPRLPQKYRSLYLLALFQLVGGPLVLLPLILFSKLGSEHVMRHGVTEGISQAWNSQDWQSTLSAIVHGDTRQPSTHKDKIPGKSKDTNSKIFATELERPTSAPGCDFVCLVPWTAGNVFASTRADAPPSPPPRWA